MIRGTPEDLDQEYRYLASLPGPVIVEKLKSRASWSVPYLSWFITRTEIDRLRRWNRFLISLTVMMALATILSWVL